MSNLRDLRRAYKYLFTEIEFDNPDADADELYTKVFEALRLPENLHILKWLEKDKSPSTADARWKLENNEMKQHAEAYRLKQAEEFAKDLDLGATRD